jgi:hypothetical protein
MELTTVWDSDGMGGTQEVLSQRGYLTTIADRDRTIIAS